MSWQVTWQGAWHLAAWQLGTWQLGSLALGNSAEIEYLSSVHILYSIKLFPSNNSSGGRHIKIMTRKCATVRIVQVVTCRYADSKAKNQVVRR